MWYTGLKGTLTPKVDDVVYAEDSVDAIKKFVIRNCGRYNVIKCEEINMKQAVCALIVENGKILCVSRKDDHTDFGLPGGKVDAGESLVDAVRREVLEETGRTINWISPKIFYKQNGDYSVTTFYVIVGNDVQELDPSETGLVKWSDANGLLEGSSYKDYNTEMLTFFEIT